MLELDADADAGAWMFALWWALCRGVQKEHNNDLTFPLLPPPPLQPSSRHLMESANVHPVCECAELLVSLSPFLASLEDSVTAQ
jgi:hypothetical protein